MAPGQLPHAQQQQLASVQGQQMTPLLMQQIAHQQQVATQMMQSQANFGSFLPQMTTVPNTFSAYQAVPTANHSEDSSRRAMSVTPYRRSWTTKNHVEVHTTLSAGLDHHLDSQAQVSKLKSLVHRVVTDGEAAGSLLDSITAIESHLANVSECFSEMVHPNVYNQRVSLQSSAVVLKVFDVPELLENILSNLTFTDILNVQPVNKTFDSLIKTSPKLQKEMGLRSSDGQALRLPLQSLTSEKPASTKVRPGLECYCSVYNTMHPYFDGRAPREISAEPRQKDSATVTYIFTTNSLGRLPAIGKTYRNMLISQPPPTNMRVQFSCCMAASTHSMSTTCTSASGLKLEAIYDTAKRIVAAHRLCPDAPPTTLNEAGFVPLRISFIGSVEISSSDPLLQQQVGLDSCYPAYAGPMYFDDTLYQYMDQDRVAHLTRYTSAKQAARKAGKRIPTLAEYEAIIQTANAEGEGERSVNGGDSMTGTVGGSHLTADADTQRVVLNFIRSDFYA